MLKRGCEEEEGKDCDVIWGQEASWMMTGHIGNPKFLL